MTFSGPQPGAGTAACGPPLAINQLAGNPLTIESDQPR